ncbi:NAD synthetase [Hyphomicrobium nitrativorans NL23]|uniref:Glutamine-dependent NAD(+) synthetase n=1 Tax=Hyphomicrobium nitrativorans NL23 TaxID=1029756 RepID=V5SH97_9HYPH|nr:NAD+ synthase [Hyphomicrobium nitrativorans]AHB49304.1 NAD synthetase [Hyphomicrobium nitrativorans NL23]
MSSTASEAQAEPTSLKIALAQLNPTVGDLDGNEKKLLDARAIAAAEGVDLVVFPELFLTGYPPEDLVLKPAFHAAARARAEALAARLGPGPAVLVGTVWPEGDAIYNAVLLLDGGTVAAVRHKVDLPNYGVFDEKRVFRPGSLPSPIGFRGVRLGVPICEDIWNDEVTECLTECGAEILLVPNGSPFDWKKPDVRMNIAVARVTESGLPLAYVNQIGGQDELVFDGASFVLNSDRSLACQLPAWEEHVAITEWTRGPDGWTCAQAPVHTESEGDGAAYQACVLGLRDYVNKNGFPGVVLGLSGGIDSALVAAMSVDALGADRVHAIMMPYRYTSDQSIADAKACAEALGIRLDTVPIAPAVDGFTAALEGMFRNHAADLTEENIQSRARGVIVMAISNKFGAMVVTTGNKSEMSVGYATLYGDMNGGFNPVKDLYKLEVYRLSRWRNAHVPKGGFGPAGEAIPESIITRVPTAELRENQTDQDSLPPYDVLDDILVSLVEHELPVAGVIARGHDPDVVRKVERLLYLAEYKRRQAAPGVKISSRNFGRDRRYPITNRFREER